MMFLKLKSCEDKDIFIAPEKVCSVKEANPNEDGEPQTIISYGANYVLVKGNVENVVDLLVEVANLDCMMRNC